MTEETLLDGNTEPKSYKELLVGEGKKFKDEESLAKGKYESDAYVKVLEKRIDDLRDDYLKMRDESQARAKLEDLIDQLESKSTTEPTQQTSVQREQPTKQPIDIDALVDRKITEKEQARQSQANLNVVKGKIKERFGDNADAVHERIEASGLSETELLDIARRSPKAALNMLGLDETNQNNSFQAPPQSSRTFKPVTDKKRTWAYYQEMKKSNPKLYLDPKIATEMHDSALALGNSFYDGDFGEYTPVS